MSEKSSDRPLTFLQELRRTRILAILRGLPPNLVMKAVGALHAGGIRLFEVTTDSPDWEESLARLVGWQSADNGLGQIGVGTVLTRQQAEAAERQGAMFLVSPILGAAVAAVAREARLAYVPGAMTPGEIYAAHALGATCIKVFPADRLGPQYLSRVLQPMAFLNLVPTGGVTVAAAAEYLKAGALGVALGSGLIDRRSLQDGDDAPTRNAAAQLIGSLP